MCLSRARGQRTPAPHANARVASADAKPKQGNDTLNKKDKRFWRQVGSCFLASASRVLSRKDLAMGAMCSKGADGVNYKYVVLGGGNAAGYVARAFIEHGAPGADLCIITEENVRPAYTCNYPCLH